MTRRRWEIVATLSGRRTTWVLPETQGRHYRRTWLGAWWTARRWNREAEALGNEGPLLVWVVRRTP